MLFFLSRSKFSLKLELSICLFLVILKISFGNAGVIIFKNSIDASKINIKKFAVNTILRKVDIAPIGPAMLMSVKKIF